MGHGDGDGGVGRRRGKGVKVTEDGYAGEVYAVYLSRFLETRDKTGPYVRNAAPIWAYPKQAMVSHVPPREQELAVLRIWRPSSERSSLSSVEWKERITEGLGARYEIGTRTCHTLRPDTSGPEGAWRSSEW